MVLTRGDGDETGVGRGDAALTVRVASPCDDGAIDLQPEAVSFAAGERDEAGVGRGNAALASGVVPPSHNPAGAFQAQAVIPASRDRHERRVASGTLHWPLPLNPHATTEPSRLRPRLCRWPLAMATKSVFGAGTNELTPQTAIELSARKPRL